MKIGNVSVRRPVLSIPLEEVKKHLASNDRQDVKIVVPERLGEELYKFLVQRGKSVKQEVLLEDRVWKHSEQSEPNLVCESSEFLPEDGASAHCSFALSFANEKASQDRHFHELHVEIYFSEHTLSATYQLPGTTIVQDIELKEGGVLIFGPGVVHCVQLKGLTLVIEVPSVTADKVLP